jgi:hypothetical protein
MLFLYTSLFKNTHTHNQKGVVLHTEICNNVYYYNSYGVQNDVAPIWDNARQLFQNVADTF